MKQYLLVLAFQFFIQLLNAQKYNETVVFSNEDIKIELLCRDTASTDQSDWIKLKIKNKTNDKIFITDAEYAINEEITAANGEKYLDYGKYGQANKYDLFHYYYDLQNPSDDRNGMELSPHSELTSWKDLTNYASVLIEPRNKVGEICPIFQLKLTYIINDKSKILESKDSKFCFDWMPDSQISQVKLVQRLRNTLTDVHFRWVNTYIISHLMGKPDIVSQISSDDFVNAVILRKHGMTDDENILFLNELRVRKAIPDNRLTERYRKDLKNPISYFSDELIYYWDNDLLDDLLKSQVDMFRVCRILEANSNFWSLIPENRTKVYNYLSNKIPFNKESPTNENFTNWSNGIKLISISRDKRVIDYLVSLLENESEFSIEDWSKYRHSGIMPRNAKPDTLKIRVCDVAFVSLLRAIGQTDYKIDARIGTKYFGLTFKKEFIERQDNRSETFMFETIDYNLSLAEKSIKLTSESKVKIINFVKSIK